MTVHAEFRFSINRIQCRMIVHALVNAMIADRRSFRDGSLNHPEQDWMDLIRLFSAVPNKKAPARKAGALSL